MKLPDHQVPLHGNKSRAVTHKEDPGEVTWGIQMLEEDVVQQAGHSILCAPLGPVGKLEGVQLLVDICSSSFYRHFIIMDVRAMGHKVHWSGFFGQ